MLRQINVCLRGDDRRVSPKCLQIDEPGSAGDLFASQAFPQFRNMNARAPGLVAPDCAQVEDCLRQQNTRIEILEWTKKVELIPVILPGVKPRGNQVLRQIGLIGNAGYIWQQRRKRLLFTPRLIAALVS